MLEPASEHPIVEPAFLDSPQQLSKAKPSPIDRIADLDDDLLPALDSTESDCILKSCSVI